MELQRCEIESRIFLDIKDKDVLYTEFDKLAKRKWENLQEISEPAQTAKHFKDFHAGTIIQVTKAAHRFRDITILCGIKDATPDELALFSRVSSVITGMFYETLNDSGLYVHNNSWPM